MDTTDALARLHLLAGDWTAQVHLPGTPPVALTSLCDLDTHVVRRQDPTS